MGEFLRQNTTIFYLLLTLVGGIAGGCIGLLLAPFRPGRLYAEPIHASLAIGILIGAALGIVVARYLTAARRRQ